jgi:SAM-dependent methyltransferase
MTPDMLDRARAAADRAAARNVEFRLGEIEHLPVADGTVDVVLWNCVVNLSPDKAGVFREAYRVLRPNGRLALCEMMTDGPPPEAVRTALGSAADGVWAEPDCVAAIEAAGFVTVERVSGCRRRGLGHGRSLHAAGRGRRRPAPGWAVVLPAAAGSGPGGRGCA